MSLQALMDLAEERDAGVPRRPAARRKGEAGSTPTADEQQRRADVLIAAIPTEVLGPYTAIVGVIVATIDPGESNREVLRWALYGACLAAVVLSLWAGYARRKDRKRVFPIAETAAAVVAFAAWGLVMPGGPLSLELTGKDDLTIATTIITAAGVFLIGVLLGTPLKNQAKR